MQIKVTCSDCGRDLGAFIVPSGKDVVIEVHACHACYHAERHATSGDKHLPDGATRCHDSGCGEHRACLRWIDRDNPAAKSHMASLFPYDVPLGVPCPMRIAPAGDGREEGERWVSQ